MLEEVQFRLRGFAWLAMSLVRAGLRAARVLEEKGYQRWEERRGIHR
jgi:hypothetical protein